MSDKAEIMITTVFAALTPAFAFIFRAKRARKPRTSAEKLYDYYENYIDRLEKSLLKKDELINELYKQMEDMRTRYETIISELEQKVAEQRTQIDASQKLIDKLHAEVQDMQKRTKKAHQHLQDLKHEAIDAEIN